MNLALTVCVAHSRFTKGSGCSPFTHAGGGWLKLVEMAEDNKLGITVVYTPEVFASENIYNRGWKANILICVYWKSSLYFVILGVGRPAFS